MNDDNKRVEQLETYVKAQSEALSFIIEAITQWDEQIVVDLAEEFADGITVSSKGLERAQIYEIASKLFYAKSHSLKNKELSDKLGLISNTLNVIAEEIADASDTALIDLNEIVNK